jgi:hypothetical protein
VRLAYPVVVLSLLAATSIASAQPNPFSQQAGPSDRPPATHSIQQLIELTPPDGGVDGFFGQSVAIAGDTIAVESFSNNDGQGKIYVYVKPSTGWQDATVTAELTIAGFSGWMASPVVISPDGSTIVVNGAFDSNYLYPEVFVFVKPVGGWVNMTQTAALNAKDGGEYDFGYSIATDGDDVLVGALGCSGNGDFTSGKAYLFVKPANGWTNMTSQTADLEESDAIGCDDYGNSVAIQGDTAVVGRTGAGMTPPVAPGSVFVFTKPSTGWVTMKQTAQLSAEQNYLNSGLGYQVSLSGNSILALTSLQGSPNSGALIFTEPSGGWVNGTQNATLTDIDEGVSFLGAGSALNGTTAALISVDGTIPQGVRGLVLYDQPEGGWQNASSPNDTIIPSDETVNNSFGSGSVAMSGDTIVVGYASATRNGITAEGSAYIFQQN